MSRTDNKSSADNHNGPDENSPIHPAFEKIRSQYIESLNISVEEYSHRATGAKHYHLKSDSVENVFLVAFRTVPMDSTGVAHILEHTALCGSRNYPVRDPFFMMIRRSLNTFMNAFTSSDWTAYPFASQNKKDFNNLLDVYLDAAFFARLHELDFAQEGHRVEFEEPEKTEGKLVFKGVVYNEMKGAMSSPSNEIWQSLSSYLFPTTTYHYNSGGEPENIPDLSYAELKEFYKTHYHPSNAIFMTYGDIPVNEHHARFEDQVLSHFDRLETNIGVNEERRFDSPVEIEDSYALDEADMADDKTHVVMAWLLGKSTDLEAQLKAHLLTGVLLDNGASPLRHILETTELGSSPSSMCGLEDSNFEMSFMCGLEGAKSENADAIEKLILGVLENVAKEGVPQDQIEAALHQLELHQREIGGDSYPYGLQLILECLPAAIHRGDPVAILDLDPVIDRLKDEIKDPDFIKRLVRENLLENTHRLRLSMTPDTELSRKRKMAEEARLRLIKENMTEADKARVVEQTKALLARQAQKDDPEILPKVSLEDIPQETKIAVGNTVVLDGKKISFYNQGTNGIVYQQLVQELPQFNPQNLDTLSHFTTCLTQLGCGEHDYLEAQSWQSRVSGGIHAYTSMRGRVDDEQNTSGYFVLSGKALASNSGKLAELMQQTLVAPRFDELGRIREIITQKRTRMEQSVTGNGHTLAMMAASSGMSPVAEISHHTSGLAGIHALKGLDDSLDNRANLEKLASRFNDIHTELVRAPRQFLVVAEQDKQQHILDEICEYWPGPDAQAREFMPFSTTHCRNNVKQLWTTSTQVNFCAKAYPTVPIDHEDAAALAVLGGFLRNGYLHNAVREHGGAYGGGASHDADIAAFRFFSYRDPRLEETLRDFDRSIEWLLQEKHEWRQLEEAIFGVISSIDKPNSPAGEAKHAFHSELFGRTPEQRNRFRKRVLSLTLEDLQRVGALYLKPENASVAVITSVETLNETGDMGMTVCSL